MEYSYSARVHISPYYMEVVPSDQKNSPYISKKDVGGLLHLNNKFEFDGKSIRCSEFSSLFVLNGINCYRSGKKLKIS